MRIIALLILATGGVLVTSTMSAQAQRPAAASSAAKSPSIDEARSRLPTNATPTTNPGSSAAVASPLLAAAASAAPAASVSTAPPTAQPTIEPQPPSIGGAAAAQLAPVSECGYGIAEQGLTPAMFAQGVGDFLTERAAQEVTAFATVELFSRLCGSDGATIMPNTCNLLGGQDNGANPVGLGLLKRTVEQDLQHLPDQLLIAVYDRVKMKIADLDEREANDAARLKTLNALTNTLCAVDLGVAVTQAIRARVKMDEIITEPAKDGLNALRRYSRLSSVGACPAMWAAMEQAIDADVTPVRAAAKDLYMEIGRVYSSKSAAEAREARLGVAEKAVALAKVLLQKAGDSQLNKHEGLLDELSKIAAAIWNEDWIGVVSSAGSADALGPLLLCKNPEEECKRDERVRLLLSISADIAQAKSSADVQAALNRVAEPIGSWRRKFQDTFTLTLQGYAGAKLAYETVQGNTPTSMAVAPVLALGIEASFHAAGRLAVFAQLVDVGNVASVRFAEQDAPNLTRVEVTPDVTWAQLFSPGAYVIWAPLKAPFVLGAGVDYVAALRQTLSGPRSAWHVGGFLAVDVPVLEIAHE